MSAREPGNLLAAYLRFQGLRVLTVERRDARRAPSRQHLRPPRAPAQLRDCDILLGNQLSVTFLAHTLKIPASSRGRSPGLVRRAHRRATSRDRSGLKISRDPSRREMLIPGRSRFGRWERLRAERCGAAAPSSMPVTRACAAGRRAAPAWVAHGLVAAFARPIPVPKCGPPVAGDVP